MKRREFLGALSAGVVMPAALAIDREMLVPAAGLRQVRIQVGGRHRNLRVFEEIVGGAEPVNLHLTLLPDCWLYSLDPAHPPLDLTGFPEGSIVTVENHGIIQPWVQGLLPHEFNDRSYCVHCGVPEYAVVDGFVMPGCGPLTDGIRAAVLATQARGS